MTDDTLRAKIEALRKVLPHSAYQAAITDVLYLLPNDTELQARAALATQPAGLDVEAIARAYAKESR